MEGFFTQDLLLEPIVKTEVILIAVFQSNQSEHVFIGFNEWNSIRELHIFEIFKENF